MVRLRSILCAIDFSEASREAVRLAVEIAQRSGGTVTVLFVRDPMFLTAAAAAVSSARPTVRRTGAELRRFVEETTRAPFRPPHRVTYRVVEGRPAREILRAATECRSDLIVMGTHGLGGFDKLFFGSTTGKVLRGTLIPVLAVPPSKIRGAIRRVVVPLDLEGQMERELNDGGELARLFDAELVLAHVVPRFQLPPWLVVDIAADDRRRLAKAREAVQRARGKVPADLRTAISAAVGDPAQELARLAANGSPSLIVMALRGSPRARRGSTTERVLARAAAPLLAVPRR